MQNLKYLLLLILTPTICFAQELKEQLFFENSVAVQIPSNFAPVNEESAKVRFPDEATRPQLIYTDDEGLATIAMSMVPKAPEVKTIIHFFTDVKNDLRTNHPEHRVITSDVIRNRTLAFIEVMLPNQDGEMLYNMMGFRYIGSKLFTFNFSCPEQEMNKYQDTARDIVKNIRMLEKR